MLLQRDPLPLPHCEHPTYHALIPSHFCPVPGLDGGCLVLPDLNPGRHDQDRLPGWYSESLRLAPLGYALRRGPDWVCAPVDHDRDSVIPWPVTLEPNRGHAWLAPTVEVALERQALVRNCWGWATVIQAIR